MGKQWKQWDFIFWGSKITAACDYSQDMKKTLAPWKKSHDQSRQHIKKQRHWFAYKGLYRQSHGFSSSHVWMWELDHKEDWVPKNWCFWTVVLEKTLESALDYKKIKPVNPKRNQSWIFIGRTDAEAQTPVLWPPDVKSIHWKRPWCWERLRTGGEGGDRGWDGWVVSWLNGHKFEQTSGDSEGQRSLECCSSWCGKESDMTATEQQLVLLSSYCWRERKFSSPL